CNSASLQTNWFGCVFCEFQNESLGVCFEWIECAGERSFVAVDVFAQVFHALVECRRIGWSALFEECAQQHTDKKEMTPDPANFQCHRFGVHFSSYCARDEHVAKIGAISSAPGLRKFGHYELAGLDVAASCVAEGARALR